MMDRERTSATGIEPGYLLRGKRVLVIGAPGLREALSQQFDELGVEVSECLTTTGEDGIPDLSVIDALIVAAGFLPNLPDLLGGPSTAISPLPTILIQSGGGESRSDLESAIDVDFTLQVGDAAPGYIVQLLRLLFERKQLQQEHEETCHELTALNTGLYRMVEDKVREISTLKDQLAAMFLAVPDVLSASTIDARFERAAQALTTPNFFRECSLLYRVADDEWRCVSVGIEAPNDIEEEYRKCEIRLGQQRESVVLPELSESGLRSILLPLKSGEGQLIGIAKLSAPADDFPGQRESLALVELFIDEVVQSVEHFQLERHLEQSEASYRLLIDNVSDVIFRLDEAGRFTFVSRRVQEILGITWKQILSRHFWEFMHPDDVESAQRKFRDLMDGHSTTQDLRMIRPDGREIIAYVSVDPIIERGVVTGALGVARDVTEKRMLEMQISESERKYRRLTENAYDAIFLVDADSYEIVDVNPRAEELTGYARQELIGMSMMNLRQEDETDTVRLRIEEVMRSGVGRYEDSPLVRKDQSTIDVETAASSLELEGKRYYHAIMRDISEHRRMTTELHQRVMELQILAEVSDALQSSIDLDSVMGIVLAGVTAGGGLGFNRAFVLTYDQSRQELRGEAGVGPGSAEEAGRIWRELAEKGMSLPEILSRKVFSVSLENDTSAQLARSLVIPLDEEHQVFSSVLESREARVIDHQHGGDTLPPSFYERYHAREFAVVPLITREGIIGVILVDNLVTGARIDEQDLHRLKLFANSGASAIERSRLLKSLEKRLHELTLANRELKVSRDRLVRTERLSAIGEVAASVAHEIRNPLVAIGGFARAIYQNLPEEDRNKASVRVIVEETDRLESILSGLLEFSRPSVPRFTDTDLNSLILQTVHFMDAEIDDDLIHVTYDLDAELPRVWADAQQLRQVLLNLIRNAIQAMPNGGTIAINTAVIQSEAQISIEDNGPGIPPDQIERIFDAFFTTKSTGSGLGLAICSQIIRNHNGRISVVPGQVRGAKFVVTLPFAQKSA